MEMIKPFKYSETDLIYHTLPWREWKEANKLSQFDQLIHASWDAAVDQGIFRYSLQDLESRLVPGRYRYVLQLNMKRGTERRRPEFMQSVSQPFDSSKFNFNKVPAREIVCLMQPQHSLNCHSPQVAIQCNGVSEENAEDNGRHLVIVNVSPLEYGHILLTPDVQQCHPQHMTLRALRLSIDMLLLSAHPGMRLAFNGLCALASVNHLHIHAWYISESLHVEDAPVRHVIGPLYEMVGMPTQAFVLQLHGNTINDLARYTHQVTEHLYDSDIAHNVVLVRAPQFGEVEGSRATTIRVLIWPRKSVTGAKSETGITGMFNVAAAELAGHVPMYFPDRYGSLTEDDITSRMEDYMLTEAQFEKLRQHFRSVFSQEQSEEPITS